MMIEERVLIQMGFFLLVIVIEMNLGAWVK